MRILVTGRGASGSWQVRGVQLGNAIGATVKASATVEEMQANDIVVVVKRVTPELAENLRRSRRKIVWDMVDWYRQPNKFSRDELVRQAKDYAAAMGASTLVAATKRMADDLETPHWLPHHGHARGINQIRERVSTVVYEGSARYVEDLRPEIDSLCSKRKWKFVINPPDYLAADIVIALRSKPWDCYASRHWKSGVKLSNAQITGVPFIGSRESGYLEQASGTECWADSIEELKLGFELLSPYQARKSAHDAMLKRSPRLEDVACKYVHLLNSL